MADDVVGKLIFQVDTDTEEAKKGLEGFQDSMEDTQKVAQQTEQEVGKAESGISVKAVAIATAVGMAVVKLGKEVAKATSEIQDGRATIVNATGASGEALQGLMDSAKAVYAESEASFDEVSRAIGEINTRLGYTDEALETTTALFLDFADATGQDVQQSVIAVTQAMNRWNIDAEQMPLLLDKLTVAGQASGISVAGLTANLAQNAGTLQAMGYSMDESIAMMMQFEKQGIDSNAVLMAMKKSFEDSANAGTDARADWEDLLASITNATDQAEANSIAVQAFGNRIATDMVSALQSGSLNFDDFAEAIANAEGVLEATDEASKTTADRIEELKHSVTLMLSEVGEELVPMVEELLPTVKVLLDSLFEAIKPIIPVLGNLISQLLPPLMEIIISLVDVIVPIIETLLPPLASALELVGNILSALLTIASPILEVMTKILNIGSGLVSSMLTPMLALLTPIFNLIADGVNAVLNPLVTVLEKVVGWIESIVNGIKKLVGWIGDGIASMLGFKKATDEATGSVKYYTESGTKADKLTKNYTADMNAFTKALNQSTSADNENVKIVKNNAESRKTSVVGANKAITESNNATTENQIQNEEKLTRKQKEEAEKRQVETKNEEDARVKAFNDSNQLIQDAMKGLTVNVGSAISNLVDVFNNEFATTEDKLKALQTATLAFAGLAGNALYELGKSVAEGSADWTTLGKTALKALASIVRALAEEMTARAVLAYFSLNIAGGIALTAGATAAFIGAGLIEGYANSLLVGKDYVPYDDYPATLHRGEMVLDRMDAEKLRRYGGMYGVEQIASQPLGMDMQSLSPLNINNQLSAVIEVDGTQLGIAVLKNIDNASQFILR